MINIYRKYVSLFLTLNLGIKPMTVKDKMINIYKNTAGVNSIKLKFI